MNIEPYEDDVSLAGPDAARAEHIDDLLRILATVRKRFGDTCVTYSIQWGATAMHTRDRRAERIEKLEKALSLHRAMVACGEKPSKTSELYYKEAMDW